MDVGFTFCDPWVEPVVQLPPRVEYYSVIIAAIIVLLFCCGGILYLHHQRTLRRKNMLRWEDSGYTPVIKPPAKDGGWHLFLSHKYARAPPARRAPRHTYNPSSGHFTADAPCT